MSAGEQGANAVEGRWLTIPRSLCFILNGDDVLLMKHGAHKRVFPNRYNGVGGHIERHEDPLSGARREIFEETGLRVRDLCLKAIYNIDAGAQTGILLFVFTAYSPLREFVADGREGTLQWVTRQELLQLDLVEDLPHILPRVLELPPEAAPLFVHVSYDNQDQILLHFANNETTY